LHYECYARAQGGYVAAASGNRKGLELAKNSIKGTNIHIKQHYTMINYRVRQDNTSWSRYPKHKFAHSVNLGTVDTDELSRIIQSNCSVKRSDVMAVLIELGETVRSLLADSRRVHIKGLGWLKVGIQSEPCPPDRPFSPKMIRGLRVKFQPEKDLLPEQPKFVELPVNEN
jgi:predicted histone-like DNA-binding protein